MTSTELPGGLPGDAARPGASPPHALTYRSLLVAALREDLGTAGDLTTDAVVDECRDASGQLVVRAPGRLAGLPMALETLRILDPGLQADIVHADGSDVAGGAVVASVRGNARALLSSERVALNLLGRLSGIATATRDAVLAVGPHPARVTDTRKTTPGLRALEKYAVRVGGGTNHRFGLDDAVLIKDNHVALAGGVIPAIDAVSASVGHAVLIEVEVDTLEQLESALSAGAPAVLLDNMDTDTLTRAVAMARGRAITEASGGITLESLAEVAATGVDVISLGWLTHSAPALDVGLDIAVSPETE